VRLTSKYPKLPEAEAAEEALESNADLGFPANAAGPSQCNLDMLLLEIKLGEEIHAFGLYGDRVRTDKVERGCIPQAVHVASQSDHK
jgi:hypothetical protein